MHYITIGFMVAWFDFTKCIVPLLKLNIVRHNVVQELLPSFSHLCLAHFIEKFFSFNQCCCPYRSSHSILHRYCSCQVHVFLTYWLHRAMWPLSTCFNFCSLQQDAVDTIALVHALFFFFFAITCLKRLFNNKSTYLLCLKAFFLPTVTHWKGGPISLYSSTVSQSVLSW